MASEILKKYKLKAEQASAKEKDIDSLIAFRTDFEEVMCGSANIPPFLDDPKYQKQMKKHVCEGAGIIVCAFEKWVSDLAWIASGFLRSLQASTRCDMFDNSLKRVF